MERNLFTPIISKKNKIAFLWFPPIKGDRHDFDFKSLKNFGASMLIDVLFNAGYDVRITDKENANKFDIILVSLTSNLDMIALSRNLHNDVNWKNRKFKVMAGGFGMQNYIPIAEYIDYAFWGRAENDIVSIIDNNFEIEHKSLLKIGAHKKVWINQSTELYPNVYTFGNGTTKEQIYGCPNKCFFCHYSFARKYIKTTENLYSFNQGYTSSIEIEQCKKELYTNKLIPTITTSIDGYSERLRYSVNKRIPNMQIVEFIKSITDTTKCKALRLKIYNITGYETENENDYNEFLELINGINNLKVHININIHSTPLNPSICTPVAYSAIDVNRDYNKYKVCLGKKGINIIRKSETLICVHDTYLEDASSLLEHTIPIRTTFNNIEIFNILAYDKKYRNLRTPDKIEYLSKINGFNDIIREYSINEELPTQYVNSFIEYDKLKIMRTKMRNALYNNA
ncbi:MAG: cobalamin B12-binding domain-containing protein [Crenarchaeota archaeon]|nr:cobalamin B12-binding domain-containing protein [Thermoproteota archaeon]